jgi:hypothetical protein
MNMRFKIEVGPASHRSLAEAQQFLRGLGYKERKNGQWVRVANGQVQNCDIRKIGDQFAIAQQVFIEPDKKEARLMRLADAALARHMNDLFDPRAERAADSARQRVLDYRVLLLAEKR